MCFEYNLATKKRKVITSDISDDEETNAVNEFKRIMGVKHGTCTEVTKQDVVAELSEVAAQFPTRGSKGTLMPKPTQVMNAINLLSVFAFCIGYCFECSVAKSLYHHSKTPQMLQLTWQVLFRTTAQKGVIYTRMLKCFSVEVSMGL